MSDKTSQRTEEEMLDQTFVGYDEEMTVQTEDGAKDSGGAAAAPVDAAAKKKNQNLMLAGVVGVAALGILGFKFLGGNNAAPQPVQEPMQPAPQQQVQAPVTAPVAATTEPVQVPVPVAPVVPTPVAVPVAVAPVVEQTQAASAPVVDPVSQYTGNTSSATLPKIEIKPEVKPEVKPEIKPEVKPEIKPEVNVEKVAAVVATNAEASSSNEKLLAQFQEMLDRKYDPKFNKIEKSLDEQKEFNRSIEERLARLEAGKTTKASAKPVVSSNDSDTTTEPKVVKKIVRKPVVIRQKAEPEVRVNKSIRHEDGEVLIDRSSVKTKPEIQRIEPVYPKIEIHSVYSGRIWTKNSDGTLSTFAVGDRLPTGEVIKKIDEEKEKITTDKRVLSQ